MQEKIDKLDYIKDQELLFIRRQHKKSEKESHRVKKLFTVHTTYKGLVSRRYSKLEINKKNINT